jgi:hypothetical protein
MCLLLALIVLGILRDVIGKKKKYYVKKLLSQMWYWDIFTLRTGLAKLFWLW